MSAKWAQLRCVLCEDKPIPMDGEHYYICKFHEGDPRIEGAKHLSCAKKLEHQVKGSRIIRWALQRRKAGNYTQAVCADCYEENRERREKAMEEARHEGQQALDFSGAPMVVQDDDARFQELLSHISDEALRAEIIKARDATLAKEKEAQALQPGVLERALKGQHVPATPTPTIDKLMEERAPEKKAKKKPGPKPSPEKRDTTALMAKATEVAMRICKRNPIVGVSVNDIFLALDAVSFPGLEPGDSGRFGAIFHSKKWKRIGFDESTKNPVPRWLHEDCDPKAKR